MTVLNLSKNPSFKEDKKNGDSFEDAQSSEFICPVTGLEMTGVYRLVQDTGWIDVRRGE